MQTTLLTIAVAVILALVAALVGPFFIDWTTYRALFEKEATRLVGTEVHVRGAIDARLLPSPRLQLNDVTVGANDTFRARTLNIEFALGPLLRGEWRADEMRVTGPEIRVGIDRSGEVIAPSLMLNIDPDALSINRLNIEDGKAVLSDAASGAKLELDKVWFNGELRSLLGPIKGEGAATVGGALYPFRLSSGRVKDDGAMRVRLNIDPTNTPVNVEADGLLSLPEGKPQFQGTWSLAHTVSIASRNTVTQPWRVGGKIKATPASALMEQVDFQYGSDTEGVKLNGTAELRFGPQPRFNGVLSARQIDLDKLAGEDEASHTPPTVTIRRLVGLAGQAFRPPFPIELGLGIDAVTLGGADLQSLRGDVSSAAGGWQLDRFEFRAPGLSEVRLSGRLGFEQNGAVFTGPAEVAANDPGALAAWLEGRKDAERGSPRPLRLRGDVTLGSEKIAIERLNANFNRGAVSGRFVYAFGKTGARVDASLKAPELDLDAASSFVNALIAGSSVERPKQGTLALDLDRARYAGIETGKTSARLTYDGNGIKIDQLAIENFGGANVSARGQIALAPAPHGSIALDFDAKELTGVTAILARYAPQMAERLNVVAPALAPAKLQATLKVDDDATGSRGILGVTGTAGVTKISLNGESGLELSPRGLGNARLQAQLEAADSSALARLLGVDRVVAVKKEPGTFRITLSGNPFGDLAVTTWVSSGSAEASATGTVQLAPGEWPQGSVYVNVARADLAPLRGGSLPIAFTSRLTSDGKQVVADEISAVVANSKVRGKLTASLDWPSRVEGRLDADTIDLTGLIAAASGTKGGEAWNWSTTPFGNGVFDTVRGQIALNATRANVAPNLNVRQFRGQLIVGDGEVSLENVSGAVAGGEVTGNLVLKPGADGLNTKSTIALANADVAALLPPAARPPLSGRVNLQLNVTGSGRSPATLIGSLQGSGKLVLTQAQFAGFDPRAFAAVIRAVDQGLPTDNAKVEGVAAKALDSGQFAMSKIEGDVAINAGQLRLSNTKVNAEGADLAVSGSVDLTTGTLDARLVLTGAEAAAGTRPDIFVALHGPITAPGKTLDVSGLTGWLTLRAIDLQSKKLEAIESEPKAETKIGPPAAPQAVPPAAPQTTPPQGAPRAEAPAEAAPKPIAPRKPAPPAHKPEHAPGLPPPINILPFNVAPAR